MHSICVPTAAPDSPEALSHKVYSLIWIKRFNIILIITLPDTNTIIKDINLLGFSYDKNTRYNYYW